MPITAAAAWLNSAFAAFDNEDAMRFFEQQGVPVKVERGGRVFPVSDKAADCVEAMLARVERPLFDLVLAHTGGNQLKAAEILGLNRNTLRKKLADLGYAQKAKKPAAKTAKPKAKPAAKKTAKPKAAAKKK